MKILRFYLWLFLPFVSVRTITLAQGITGTFTATETWSVTLTYNGWAGGSYSGTQQFHGTQTGTVVIANGACQLIDQSGFPNTAPASVSTTQTLDFYGTGYSLSGGAVMPYLIYGPTVTGIIHLGAFVVGVSVVDGEVPAFQSINDYIASGASLSDLVGSGNMTSATHDLIVTVSSTLVLDPVNNAPFIVQNPNSATISVGNSATFSVSAQGQAPLSYQWQQNGADISGATSATYSIANVQVSNAGNYTVVVSDSSGSVTSFPAVLTVSTIPVIATQPSSQAASIGSTVTFSVTATGPSPISYQWKFNGIPIVGATNASLVLNNVQAGNAGSYAVTVTNAGGAVTSNSATLTISTSVYTTPYAITTLAGVADTIGSADGVGSAARFDLPEEVAVDNLGNVYVADTFNDTIRKITPAGLVTTLAGLAGHSGSADGTGSAARFYGPTGIAVDSAGNLYVGDSVNNTVRKITAAGVVTTLAGLAGVPGSADGTGSAARFDFDFGGGVAVDNAGNVYVADTSNCTVRKITAAGGVTTLAGLAGSSGIADGTGNAARFGYPPAVAVDSAGIVYVTDLNNSVRKIMAGGVVTTLAGSLFGLGGHADGTGSAAQFYQPTAIAVDRAGNLYVADTQNSTIRKITAAGAVTTLAGLAGQAVYPVDGTGIAARFNQPYGVAVDNAGNIYVGDTENYVIREGIPPAAAPTITAQPVSQTATAGGTVTLTVMAAGSPLPTYQWRLNGSPITGATSATLTLTNVQVANGGSYTVTVTNGSGSVTSTSASLSVSPLPVAPTITTQPISVTVVTGSTVVFSVTASGSPTFQWALNGKAILGAASARLVISGATSANAGSYTCVAINPFGSATSVVATLALTSTANVGRLINLSVNTTAGKSQVLTVGFVSGGAGTTGSENLLIRATGPALAALGVPGTLADPTLSIFTSNSTVVAANDNWSTPATNQAAVTAADSATFAFPLTNAASLDAALATALPAGSYTAQISGNTASSGTALAEVYDNTPTGSYSLTTPRLINISAKNQITANGSMTAGFVVGGSTSKTVLIRATGPALTVLGVPGAIPDPQIALHTTVNGQDTVLATNAGWGGDPQITAVSNSVFAFPLTNPASTDSVVLMTLAPGNYTAVASSVSGTAGTVLIEIYEVP